MLLKQSTAAIDRIAEAFFLSEGEKHLLLSADIGEGLFFAGPAHAAMRIIASPTEHEMVTTKPQDLIAQSQKLDPSAPHASPPAAGRTNASGIQPSAFYR